MPTVYTRTHVFTFAETEYGNNKNIDYFTDDGKSVNAPKLYGEADHNYHFPFLIPRVGMTFNGEEVIYYSDRHRTCSQLIGMAVRRQMDIKDLLSELAQAKKYFHDSSIDLPFFYIATKKTSYEVHNITDDYQLEYERVGSEPVFAGPAASDLDLLKKLFKVVDVLDWMAVQAHLNGRPADCSVVKLNVKNNADRQVLKLPPYKAALLRIHQNPR